MDFRKDYDWSKVINPATDDEVRSLVAALRSGNFKQITGSLSENDGNPLQCGHCVLGVANVIWKVGMAWDEAVMTEEANEERPLKLPINLQEDLYRRNDTYRTPFNDLADYLEKGFNLV